MALLKSNILVMGSCALLHNFLPACRPKQQPVMSVAKTKLILLSSVWTIVGLGSFIVAGKVIRESDRLFFGFLWIASASFIIEKENTIQYMPWANSCVFVCVYACVSRGGFALVCLDLYVCVCVCMCYLPVRWATLIAAMLEATFIFLCSSLLLL